MSGKNDAKKVGDGLPAGASAEGGLNIVDVMIPLGKKLCPSMLQFAVKAGGFNTPQMVVFAINCVGRQCGRYNECNNIKGNEVGV